MKAGRSCMYVKFVKASEIAERFRVSRDAAYLWIRQGKIPAKCVIRIAGTVRVDEEEFEKLLRSGALYGRRRCAEDPSFSTSTLAEDSITVRRSGPHCEHRWTDGDTSVNDEHP